MNLAKIRDIVAVAWQFVIENYPQLYHLNNIHTRPGHRLAFILGHIALHQAKAAGQMATAAEQLAHGKDFDRELAVRGVRNSIINALQFSSQANIPIHEIEDAISAWAEAEHKP